LKLAIENAENILSETMDKLEKMNLKEPILRLNSLMGYEFNPGRYYVPARSFVDIEKLEKQGIEIAETVHEIGWAQDSILIEAFKEISKKVYHLRRIHSILTKTFVFETPPMVEDTVIDDSNCPELIPELISAPEKPPSIMG